MIRTPWGYDIEADTLPDILTAEEFETMTGGRYSGDVRMDPSIKAAQSAIRNYCGWHVFPVLPCSLSVRAVDKGVVRVGGDLMIQLPACGEIQIYRVTVAGKEYLDHTMEASGVLRVFDVPCLDRKAHVAVEYLAGVSGVFAEGLKEVAAHHATHALAQSYGIQSESAGGVSVTYSAQWISNSRATALHDNDKDTLNAYRLQGVF